MRRDVGALPELLERDGELARLDGWLDEAVAGRGRVVFVGGEPGIGKTALTARFAALSTAKAGVLWGRCDALATPRAMGPLLDVAAGLGRTGGGAAPDVVLGWLLDQLRSGGPRILVIDDAHWADDATIDALAVLGRRAPDLSLLLVVTYRDGEVPADHPLRLVMGDLASSAGAVWLSLSRLSSGAVARLGEGHHDPDVLFRLTGGNPFFVVEALAAPTGEVPTSVRHAVLARAGRLSAPAREALDMVALVPGHVEGWLLGSLIDDASSVDECVERRLLVEAGDGYALPHELARLAIESAVPPGRRRAMHRRLLGALVAVAAVDPSRLAHHAGEAGDEQAIADYSAAACLRASAAGAHREAVRHGERALSRIERLDPDVAAEFRVKLGYSLLATDRPDDGAEVTRAGVEHWRSKGDERREAMALIRMGAVLVGAGRTEESTAAGERAVEILERHPPSRELEAAYTRLCSGHMLARERDAAVEWGQKAISLLRPMDEPELLGRALIECGIADVMDNHFEGLALVHEGLALGRQRNLPLVVSGALLQQGSGCGEMRRYDLAVPALVEGVTYSAEHQLEYNRQYDTAWLARCRFELGEWGAADDALRDAMAGGRSSAISRNVALTVLGRLRARRGDDDPWEPLDEALELAHRTGHLQRLWPTGVARAEAGALAGELVPHVGLLEETFALAVRCRHPWAIGELGLWLRRAGRLDTVPDGAAPPYARWLAGDHLGAAREWLTIGCPYEAADALVDHGEISSLRQAVATFERLGAAPMAARTGARLRELGVRVTRRAAPAPTHPSGLSRRELEVVQLVAAGLTNPDIARALFISRKTAEHHVSNILLKLGVATRAEAAAEAVRLGVTD